MSSLSDRHLLVVDDHEDTRLLFTTTLKGEGARVVAVASAEAFNVMTWRKPDMLICDIALPNVNGCDLLHRVRTVGTGTLKRILAIRCDSTQRQPDSAPSKSSRISVLSDQTC